MSRVAIGVIAGRVVLTVEDGEDAIIIEMTVMESDKVAELLDKAIASVDAGNGMAPSFGEFLKDFYC